MHTVTLPPVIFYLLTNNLFLTRSVDWFVVHWIFTVLKTKVFGFLMNFSFMLTVIASENFILF